MLGTDSTFTTVVTSDTVVATVHNYSFTAANTGTYALTVVPLSSTMAYYGCSFN